MRTRHDATEEVEVPMTGGRLTAGVVRVGDTVRRPAGPHSAFVGRLLRHLSAVGFDGAPRALGVDDRGRDVLTFVDGWIPPNLDRFPDETLVAAARLLRRFQTPRPARSWPPTTRSSATTIPLRATSSSSPGARSP
jgi:hypothetical protein